MNAQSSSTSLHFQVQTLQTEQDISFEQALLASNQGMFSTAPAGLVFPGGPHYYWAKFNVKNTSEDKNTIIIEVRNAHLNYVELFEYSQNGNHQTSLGKTGDYLEFKTRPIEYRFFAFETTLVPGETRSFLLHTSKLNESIKFPITVHSQQNFWHTMNNETTLLGGYFGIYTLFILLLFIFALSKPSLLNISLFFYVMGFSLLALANSGLGFQHLWPNTTVFNNISRSIFASIASLALMFFAYVNLDLNKAKSTFISKFHRIFIIYLLINSVLFIGYYWLVRIHSPYIDFINVLVLQVPYGLQFLYLIFLSFYLSITQRNIRHLMFLLAISGVTLASLVFMLEQIGFPITGFSQEHIMLAALTFDFTILASIGGIEFYQIRIQNRTLADSLDQAIIEGAENFLEGQHNERHRLAQQVHDGASVKLSALQMQLSVLDTQDKLQQQSLIQTVNTIANDIRNFAHNLSPIILEQYGFIAAIEEVIDSLNTEQQTINIIFKHDGSSIDKTNIERELYFICLELINNALKHSQGSEIVIQFSTNETGWCLRVQDNGKGYEPNALENPGIGLQGIHWRLRLLNSRLLFSYEKGIQTHDIKIPYFAAVKT